MSYIFVLVVVAFTLLVSAVVFNTAYTTSGASSAQLDNIFDVLGTGIELGAILPFLLAIVLFIGVLGVWGGLQ